jgi:chorismate mutase/prephenate dehydratase
MKIKKLRKQIDVTDKKILGLLNKRASIAVEIGRLKGRKKEGTYVPYREKDVYKKIISENKGPLKPKALKAIYREIFSSTLNLQKPLKIAYLGPGLTFTHLASMKKFGSSVDYTSCESITDVFDEVEKGRADYGVVPIENSTEGAVSHTLDMFIDSELKICSEVYLAISLNLISVLKSQSGIKRIYSKAEVFAQCRKWLEMNLPKAELVDCPSTSKAAELASADKKSAAIASSLAAEKYKLNLLAPSIEDGKHNVTRFLVIGAGTQSRPTKDDKTSVMVSIKDRVGALYDILSLFKKHRINLTKIESRPSKRKVWDYFFFIDMEGHHGDKNVRSVLSKLEKETSFLKILGSYPTDRE